MIIVMGLPGAGKSTVLSAANGTGYTMLNYGDLMFSIAQKKFGIARRDDLRKLDPEKQKEVQSAVGDELSRMEGKILLDTHCSISTLNGYLPGLPLPLLSKLKVEQLILITAPASEILVRRQSDKTRVRDAETLESILEHEAMNLSLLAAYAFATGAPCAIISNRQGKLQGAQEKLIALLR